MSDVPCFVGIDVAKAQLDIALRPSGERWAVANDASGVATLVDRVQTLHPTLIVLEATGWPGARGDERLGRGRPPRGRRATRGRPAIVPGPRASWRKRMRWMPAPWPTLPT